MSEPNVAEGGPFNERRYYGKYRGIVMDDLDPERLGRVKCRVPEVLGPKIVTDWATPSSIAYGGGAEYGRLEVPPVKSGVFVEFESGDVNRPLYGGVWYAHPKGQASEPPQLTREDGKTKFSDDESTKSPKGDDKFTTADCSECEQPKSPAAPKYPNNQVLKTKNNEIIVEIDDTPGKSRIHFWHGPSKSWFELDHKGELSVRVADKLYALVEKDACIHVKESQHTSADKNMTHKAGQDYYLKVGGKEIRSTTGEKESFTTGEEKKVSLGGFKHWTIGDRVDVVIGNYQQFVIGKMTTNVFGLYSRMALTFIEDVAPGIAHRGGAPSETPPPPPTPKECG